MGSAAQVKRLTAKAKGKAARKEQRVAKAKIELEKKIDAEVRAGIQERFDKEWLPKIEEAAAGGYSSIDLSLGALKRFLGSPAGFDEAYEMQQRSTVKYLVELLGKEGYNTKVSYPDRKYSDDDLGQTEVDVEVSW